MPDVNPFEPWRPKQDPPSEPAEPERDVNSARPWRPPPDDAERGGADVSPFTRPLSITYPSRERASSHAATIWWTVVVVVAGLIAWGYLGSRHISRIGATAGALCLGGLIALSLARCARVRTRLLLGAAGLLAAAAAWAFVPTSGGISLVDAYRRRAEAERLPVGDLERFRQTAPLRRELVREHSTFRDDILNAEVRWAQLTVPVVIQEADNLSLAKQHRAALDRLRTLEETLRPIVQYSLDRRSASQEARKRIVRSWLDDREATLVGLIKDKKYDDARRGRDRLVEELGAEARQVGLGPELDQRVMELRRREVQGSITLAEEELNRLFEAKDYAKVARVGAAMVDGLTNRARGVFPWRGMGRGPAELMPLDEIRKKSLTAWSEQAARHLADLLAKGKLTEVARDGARLTKELQHEAVALTDEQALERLREVRAKVLRARLEAARREALALVKQDRNQAAEQLGRRTEEQLGDEARAVGAESELTAFRKACEVFGDLARKAKKSDPK